MCVVTASIIAKPFFLSLGYVNDTFLYTFANRQKGIRYFASKISAFFSFRMGGGS